MSPDFIDDLGPNDRAKALQFLAALDEYRETHTDEEFDRLIDLFKLVDQMENEPELVVAGRDFPPESEYESDNSLRIKVRAYDWGTMAEAIGTREELINSGLCADYMFDQLGDKNARSGPTEYGDRFRLTRRANQRYKITLCLSPKTKKPHGMASVDISKIDISGILKKISGCVS